MTDQLKKYLFQDHSTRVQAVKLDAAWQTGLAHQHYPECIQRLLGELASAAVLLASNLKFEGSVVLQLQGDGPVALIVVECAAGLNIRATATLREGHGIPTDGTLQSLLNTHGQGRFIVLLDPSGKTTGMSPYRGVVPLDGSTVSEVLEHYMHNSEQLETRLWLAADARHCAGLLLQRLPDAGGNDIIDPDQARDTWERAGMLASTLQPAELLQLDTDTLIHRLFWEETLLAFEPQPVQWWCPCTRKRVANMLRTLGRDEVESILAERGNVEVKCNFCGKPYQFDAIDCAGLFTKHISSQGGQSLH
ncbi:MAG: Hsp33 family molecular chaperone HslO [Burkholderiaceae bacterium]|nr:MAG: Hsp33 family molecular chaperone HslO [Burkholderiaceae bacterium]TAM10864.1 MAG: Hsp33 family molecular chaperone HslO [Pusillimonas sp.]